MSRLRSTWRALAQLRGPRDAALFVGVSIVAACVPLLLRLPLPRVAALLARGSRHRTPRPERVARLPELVGLAAEAWWPLVRTGCLTRGVTLLWFLRREGLDVELCFGIDALAAEPEGHCWLVRAGRPWLEGTDPRARFAETHRLPRPAR